MVQRAWLSHVRHLGSFLPPLPPSSGKTQNPSSLVSKVGLSGCNICARACARMSSVRTVWSACWTTPASCFFHMLAQTRTRQLAHHKTANTHSRLIRLPGGCGWRVGPNRISPPSIYRPPIQYQHGFSGLQRRSRYTPLRKIRCSIPRFQWRLGSTIYKR